MSTQLSLVGLLLIIFLVPPTSIEAQSGIDFLHNGEKFYSKTGVEIDTLGTFEIKITNGKALVKNPQKPIGAVASLARANRPIGSPILTPDLSVHNVFSWLMRQARSGDRIVVQLTNTTKQHVFSIPLR